MAGVLIERVSKIFPAGKGRAIHAVREMSLAVTDGELMVLVGPSGSGKTTLLRMIAGLEEPSEGFIALGQTRMQKVPPHERDVSMVFQDHALYAHLTVYENLAFGLRLRKTPRSEIERRVNDAAGLLGISGLAERLPAALSGGERQRVALGRALVVQASVVLLDEPLSNLDGPLRAQMRREIRKLHDRLGLTMIYVTHDQVEAMALGDRIAVLQNGAIRQVGTPLELYRQPDDLFVAGFIGVPPMNLLSGELEHREDQIWFRTGENTGAIAFPLLAECLPPSLAAASGRKVLLGCRAEDIRKLDAGESGSPGDAVLEARVETVERLGAETHVGLAAAGAAFVARAGPQCEVRAGEALRVALNLRKAHWFDPELGKAMR